LKWSANMALPLWTDVRIEQLIDLYTERPCLWKSTSEAYHKKDHRDKACQEIVEELNIACKENQRSLVNVQEVKRKIINLRSQFSHELSKAQKRRTGSGTDEVYESKWVHFRSLLFLKDYVQARKTKTNDEVRNAFFIVKAKYSMMYRYLSLLPAYHIVLPHYCPFLVEIPAKFFTDCLGFSATCIACVQFAGRN